MEVGIFARTFARDSLDGVLDAVAAAGLTWTQFNLSVAGLPTLPEEPCGPAALTINAAVALRGLRLAALSGTFNMIDPDLDRRRENLRRFGLLLQAAPLMGVPVVTLCTGTRDAADMWRGHPDNASREAWMDLCESMAEILGLAQAFGVVLAVEPEPGNVISSARHARALIDEMGSDQLRVVIDPANLAAPGDAAGARRALEEAFDLLANDIVLAHAKDLGRTADVPHVAAGRGCVDFGHYIELLGAARYEGPLVLHGLAESEVQASVAFLRDLLGEPAAEPVS